MNAQKFDVNKMRIASPCPAGWENMEGNNQKRFCNLCSLHVYNISEMTAEEVRKLVADSNGRICARIYKRADGTVLTRDCSVGVRAYRKRVSHLAGAVFSAIIGLGSAVFGQTDVKKDEKKPVEEIKTFNTAIQNKSGGVKGRIIDFNGAIVAAAQVNLRTPDNKVNLNVASSEDGNFNFSDVPPGIYIITISAPGFKVQVIENVQIEENKVTQLNEPQITLSAGEVLTGVISIIEEPYIDVSKTNTTTIITKKLLDKLPF